MSSLPALAAPVVYLGPSISRTEARDLCPEADFRPPIRRGDLYRDRERGKSIFLIIDGLFFNNLAVSPREVIDVLRDGAWVAGASSMGAIRAAECWPAGMRGIGSIYRLFRRGALGSDDEVAVTCDAEREYLALSVPLINVRFAASRSVREGSIDRRTAGQIVDAAVGLFYADRSWPRILSRAGVADPERLAPKMARFDLKKKDAERALVALSRWLAADPDGLDRPRPTTSRFLPSELVRERPPEPPGDPDPQQEARELARWQLISGRYRRHLLAVAAAFSKADSLVDRDGGAIAAKILVDGLLAAGGERPRRLAARKSYRQALERSTALRLGLQEIGSLLSLEEDSFAAGLWAELAVTGELEAELFRFRAITAAATEARERGFQVETRYRRLAEAQIAHEHGFRSWSDLEAAGTRLALSWPAFVDYRDELALAKAIRRSLFDRACLQASSPSREEASTRSGVSRPAEKKA